MAKETVATFMLRRLREWGVERVFAYPGDGSNGLDLAFRDVPELQFIQTRHEEIAALAASAHAKLTGRPGVCMATSGPGAIHLLNGLYDAKLDHTPVVAIVGQQARMSLGSSYQQEVDLHTLLKDVASEFVETCMDPRQAGHLVDRAFRTAISQRTVTAIIVPNDVQGQPYERPPRAHGAVYSSPGWSPPVVVPSAADLERAAAVLNAGERVAMLVGQGARHATAELLQVAEVLGAGIAKALNGRAVVPDDVELVTGSIGLLGTTASEFMMERCDTLLMVGTSFPYSEWLPEPGQARAVQIDVDPRNLAIRYPVEVPLTGDARETLRLLLPLLVRKESAENAEWRRQIPEQVRRWWHVLDQVAHVDAEPVNPQLVFHELSQRLPDRAILLADSGSATNWWARHLRMREGMEAALSGTLATMACAAPYALAAKLAHPDRPVIAAIGDGAFQMLGMNTLIDLVKYRDGWTGPCVLCVLHNNDLNQVTWEQRAMEGDAKFEASQDLPDFPYARYAELLGLTAVRVDRPEDVGPGWDRVLAAPGPALLEVVTDPNVPPLPPDIRLDQAMAMAKAIFRGDPDAGAIIRQSVKAKLAELTTRR
jgi:pyruvate dehydrogenase (quinone)